MIRVPLLTGPTASGKTALALEFARCEARQGRRIEPRALIADPNPNGRPRLVQRGELNVHALGAVIPVPVTHRVDDRLADREPDPMHRIVVEAGGALVLR